MMADFLQTYLGILGTLSPHSRPRWNLNLTTFDGNLKENIKMEHYIS